MPPSAKREIDRLVQGRVLCCVLKGLGHDTERQNQDTDKNNSGSKGRNQICWTVFLYTWKTFLCMTEENSLEFQSKGITGSAHL